MKKDKSHILGFTLVETLVAIAILTLSITATFTAVQNGLATSSFAKDQVIAFYLIQDAMEFIRNTRDKTALNNLTLQANGGIPLDWIGSFIPCMDGNHCIIDSAREQITQNNTNPFIKMDNNGLFQYTSGTDTRFKRDFFMEVVNSNEVIVTVSVGFASAGVFSKNITVKQIFFNTR